MTDREKLVKAIERKQLYGRERQKRAVDDEAHPSAPENEIAAQDLKVDCGGRPEKD